MPRFGLGSCDRRHKLRRALITLGGDWIARRLTVLEETSQAQLTNVPRRRPKRLQA